VDMSLFNASLDQAGLDLPGRSLWDLSAGAQTQLIQILNERYPGNAQFNGVLNLEYMGDGPGRVTDFTSSKLRMVFTVSKKKDFTQIGKGGSRFSPADRIESMKFSLQIPEEYHLSFTGWNRYATEYGEIEIADVSFSRSFDLSGDFSTEYIDGGIQSASGRKEDQTVRSRYLKLNGRISAQSIEMEAEGSRGVDLAGNVLADVSLAFEGFPERLTVPVYSSGGEDTPQELSRLRFIDVLVPRIVDMPDPIMATLEMEYIYRHVESGWKSYQEWDDRVAYYSGKVSKKFALFNKAEYLPGLCSIGSDEDGRQFIKIKTTSGLVHPLQFLDYREADRFLAWLMIHYSGPADKVQANHIKAGEYTLIWGDQPLTSPMISSGLELKVVPVF